MKRSAICSPSPRPSVTQQNKKKTPRGQRKHVIWAIELVCSLCGVKCYTYLTSKKLLYTPSRSRILLLIVYSSGNNNRSNTINPSIIIQSIAMTAGDRENSLRRVSTVASTVSAHETAINLCTRILNCKCKRGPLNDQFLVKER